jgi:excisionase family DNA binding protein
VERRAYKVHEVAAVLGLGRTTIYKLIQDGHLTRIKIGASTLIPANDVEALLRRPTA